MIRIRRGLRVDGDGNEDWIKRVREENKAKAETEKRGETLREMVKAIPPRPQAKDSALAELAHARDVLSLQAELRAINADQRAGSRARDAAFKEELHPRGGQENPGQFVAKGASGEPSGPGEAAEPAPEKSKGQLAAAKSHATRLANKAANQNKIEVLKSMVAATGGTGRKPKHVLASAPKDRAEWPEHVKKLVIPPAWTDLKINPDPSGDLLVTGKDAKGRSQYVYSEKFKATKAAEKFKRIQVLEKKFAEIEKQVEAARKGNDPLKREHAEVTRLIMQTGLRPGSETDTGAEKQAYGATTLQGQHVKPDGDAVILDFTGKKGVDLKIPVTDPELVESLKARAQQAGPTGKLFPQVSDKSLLGYVHTLDGGKFKSKDLRTRLGTKTALEEIKKVKPPTNAKEYKKAVKAVATIVSQKLGNTPTVALQSYISPVVFSGWRAAAGV